MNDSREKILLAVRSALAKPTAHGDEAEGTLFPPTSPGEMVKRFMQELAAVSGECLQATSAEEAAERAAELLRKEAASEIAVAGGNLVEKAAAVWEAQGFRVVRPPFSAESEGRSLAASVLFGAVEVAYGVAESGTLALPLGRLSSLMPAVLPETVIAFLERRSIVAGLEDLFAQLTAEERRNLMLVTGPSRTADIEKILILGAHGPRRLIVMLVGNKEGNL